MNNKPPKAESYYNQSFVDRMNSAQANIDNLVSVQNKSYGSMNSKKDEYDAFSGSMKSYGDVYESAENEFGVANAKESYEQNKKALALAESTLSALPSSINNSSNRVLTQQQREDRYNTLSNRVMGNVNILNKTTSMYEQTWKNAREAQADYAKTEIAGQWSKLDSFNNAWLKAMEEYTTASKNVLTAKTELNSIRNQYRAWQQRQYSQAYEVWQNNLNTANARYQEALKSEQAARAAAERKRQAEAAAAAARAAADRATAAARAAANANKRDFDFGNGFSVKVNNRNEAEYYQNGRRITAGSFLEHTGANGANWNMWKELWNRGISTKGVGADTVSAFSGRSASGAQYNYLFTFF